MKYIEWIKSLNVKELSQLFEETKADSKLIGITVKHIEKGYIPGFLVKSLKRWEKILNQEIPQNYLFKSLGKDLNKSKE